MRFMNFKSMAAYIVSRQMKMSPFANQSSVRLVARIFRRDANHQGTPMTAIYTSSYQINPCLKTRCATKNISDKSDTSTFILRVLLQCVTCVFTSSLPLFPFLPSLNSLFVSRFLIYFLVSSLLLYPFRSTSSFISITFLLSFILLFFNSFTNMEVYTTA